MDSKRLTELDVSGWQTVFDGYHLLTFDEESSDDEWGLIEDGALAVADGMIVWVGRADQLQGIDFSALNCKVIQGNGAFLSPGLIDCHTHLVYGGNRADEWQMRLKGKSYQEIAKAGGGIRSTVAATREVSCDELYRIAKLRAINLMKQGVTTIEIKSGYALNVADELKMLQVAKRLGESLPVTVHPTFLGAHAIPQEFEGRADAYIELVVQEMLPQAKEIATAVDVFTESIAFDLKQTERVFSAAREAELNIKIHAEQLSNMGGTRLAAEMGALSADHLEYLDESGIKAMAEHGTVAVLLPGAFYFLNETQKPPVQLLRQYEVPIALATDANPGSSPVASILLMANMGCTLFKLTPAEALKGLTCNAARALGAEQAVGRLAVGLSADLAIWDVGSPAELAFTIGHNPCTAVYKEGVYVNDEDLSV